jgi:hypothetical protein
MFDAALEGKEVFERGRVGRGSGLIPFRGEGALEFLGARGEPPWNREAALFGGDKRSELESGGGVVRGGFEGASVSVGVAMLCSEVVEDARGVGNGGGVGCGSVSGVVGFAVIDVDAVKAMGGCAIGIVGGIAEEGGGVIGDVLEAQMVHHTIPDLGGGCVEGWAVIVFDEVPVTSCDCVHLVVDLAEEMELLALARHVVLGGCPEVDVDELEGEKVGGCGLRSEGDEADATTIERLVLNVVGRKIGLANCGDEPRSAIVAVVVEEEVGVESVGEVPPFVGVEVGLLKGENVAPPGERPAVGLDISAARNLGGDGGVGRG